MQNPDNTIILCFLFVGFLACCYYTIKQRMAGGLIPLWLPTITAMVIAGMLDVYSGEASYPFSLIFIIPGYIGIMLFAVLQAFLFFERKDLGMPSWAAFFLTSGISMFLLFFLFIGGSRETFSGQPLPAFSYRFPLIGWLFDGIIKAGNIAGIAYYPPYYQVILFTGYYIEVFLIAVIILFILSLGGKPRVTAQ